MKKVVVFLYFFPFLCYNIKSDFPLSTLRVFWVNWNLLSAKIYVVLMEAIHCQVDESHHIARLPWLRVPEKNNKECRSFADLMEIPEERNKIHFKKAIQILIYFFILCFKIIIISESIYIFYCLLYNLDYTSCI
jgi:hypothetical protein